MSGRKSAGSIGWVLLTITQTLLGSRVECTCLSKRCSEPDGVWLGAVLCDGVATTSRTGPGPARVAAAAIQPVVTDAAKTTTSTDLRWGDFTLHRPGSEAQRLH